MQTDERWKGFKPSKAQREDGAGWELLDLRTPVKEILHLFLGLNIS